MATTDPAPVPGWIHPGAEVAEISQGISRKMFSRVTVEKLHKLHVVTSCGKKYSRVDLRAIGYSSGHLVPLDSPEVAEIRAESARRTAANGLDTPLREWIASGDVETLRSVISTLSAFLPTQTETPAAPDRAVCDACGWEGTELDVPSGRPCPSCGQDEINYMWSPEED